MFQWDSEKNRVTVVAFRIDRIAAIGEITPHGVGQKFIVGSVRPVFRYAADVLHARPSLYLQTNDIGADRSRRRAQLRQDEAFIKGGKTFVRINCEH